MRSVASLCPADESVLGAAARAESRPAVGPARRSRPWPWLRMSLTCAAAVAGLTHLAREAGEDMRLPGDVPPAVLVAPAPRWQPIAAAPAWYTLGASQGDRPPIIEARRHVDGGREDTLIVRSFGEDGHARATLSRGLAQREGASFYVDLVRRAAQAGLSVTRSAQTRPLATKFGVVEVTQIVLADTSEQACLAFRAAHPEVSFSLTGWLCGAGEPPDTEGQLACFIDGIGLAAGSIDPALKAIFAKADRRRLEGCTPKDRLAAMRRT
jgi:hypothetical protein